MPPNRGRGRGFGGSGGGRSSGSRGRRPGPMDGVSWSDLQKTYVPKDQASLFQEIELPHLPPATAREVATVRLLRSTINNLRRSPYYLAKPVPFPATPRYADYCRKPPELKSLREVETDVEFFPKEMRSVYDASLPQDSRQGKKKRVNFDVNATLDEFLRVEGQEKRPVLGAASSTGADNDVEVIENLEEEEIEEETDYVVSYFDNGEDDFLEDNDDGDGEAFYGD